MAAILQTMTPAASSPLLQNLFAAVRVHLQNHLRTLLDSIEDAMLADDEAIAVCCELRRHRRQLTDSYIHQLYQCFGAPKATWPFGNSAIAQNARTYSYLCEADMAVAAICHAQASRLGQLASAWQSLFDIPCDAVSCPVNPHTLARIMLQLLPELPVPVRIRQRIALAWVDGLPALSATLADTSLTLLRKHQTAARVDSLPVLPLPDPLPRLFPRPAADVRAQSLTPPAASAERIRELAIELSTAALAGETKQLHELVCSHRQTALLPWLQALLTNNPGLPAMAREQLQLLSGPLLLMTLDADFADNAHPAQRFISEWLVWAPGWTRVQADGLATRCHDLCHQLARLHLEHPEQLLSAWLAFLDTLLTARRQVQADSTASIAGARLTTQVAEMREEIDKLLAQRAGSRQWPDAVISLLRDHWSAVLLDICWREGTASDAWLAAVSVADELFASAQIDLPAAERITVMQRVPRLLQQLRKGFDAIQSERQQYSQCLKALEAVHLALLRANPASALPCDTLSCNTLPCSPWPQDSRQTLHDKALEAGSWLNHAAPLATDEQPADAGEPAAWRVLFSDEYSTVLLDSDQLFTDLYTTAELQHGIRSGALVSHPAPAPLLDKRPA